IAWCFRDRPQRLAAVVQEDHRSSSAFPEQSVAHPNHILRIFAAPIVHHNRPEDDAESLPQIEIEEIDDAPGWSIMDRPYADDLLHDICRSFDMIGAYRPRE